MTPKGLPRRGDLRDFGADEVNYFLAASQHLKPESPAGKQPPVVDAAPKGELPSVASQPRRPTYATPLLCRRSRRLPDFRRGVPPPSGGTSGEGEGASGKGLVKLHGGGTSGGGGSLSPPEAACRRCKHPLGSPRRGGL